MTRTRMARFLAPALLLALLGCVSPSLKSTKDPVGLSYHGLGNAYLAAGTEVIGAPDPRIFRAGILGSSTRKGEIASIDLWPLFGVGVGLAGARLQILPIEVGVGTLFYEPRPRKSEKKDEEGRVIPSEPETSPVPPVEKPH